MKSSRKNGLIHIQLSSKERLELIEEGKKIAREKYKGVKLTYYHHDAERAAVERYINSRYKFDKRVVLGDDANLTFPSPYRDINLLIYHRKQEGFGKKEYKELTRCTLQPLVNGQIFEDNHKMYYAPYKGGISMMYGDSILDLSQKTPVTIAWQKVGTINFDK